MKKVMGFVLSFFSIVLEANADGAHIQSMGLTGILPFLGLLGSVALLPMLKPHMWERSYSYVVIGWIASLIIPFLYCHGFAQTATFVQHVFLKEYFPFAVLVTTLYVVTSNISISHIYQGSPLGNTLYLLIAGFSASICGTTGAAMIFIRPFLSANAHRKYFAHGVVFFIFLVANIGGALTPLGDPPLFLGFLNGVPFLWPFHNLLLPTLVAFIVLLSIFYVIDKVLSVKEGVKPTAKKEKMVVKGKHNIVILLGVVSTLMFAGQLKIEGWAYADLFSDLTLIGLSILSYCTSDCRNNNTFTWGPIKEVLYIFMGLFILVAPVISLFVEKDPSIASILEWFVSAPKESASRYFWGTGIFSSFLDNAPTYLVFAHMSGLSLTDLMQSLPKILAAISAGAVFMGAMTYIGNAPNFMVKAIVDEQKIPIPGFVGYMLWSFGVLLPVLMLVDYIFFSGAFKFVVV